MKTAALVLGALALVGGTIVLARTGASPHASTRLSSSSLPALTVCGNRICRADTHAPVVLRGAVSDYFRYGNFNANIVRASTLDAELSYVGALKAAGANIIGLYLSDSVALRAHGDELDRYIAYAREHRMYVYLMPVAREFNGRHDPADASRPETFSDLVTLESSLAKRYGGDPTVIYGFGAEPEGDTDASWQTKELTLDSAIHEGAPDALVFVTSTMYREGLENYLTTPFPDERAVYFGGGYTSEGDADAEAHQTRVEKIIADMPMSALSAQHPYFVGEFGGNYGNDFSSADDLSTINAILDELNAHDLSYTMYKLSPNNPKDGLALYDWDGTLTKRGEAFMAALKAAPPTQF